MNYLKRIALAAIAASFSAVTCQAHFVYILPGEAGNEVQVVFTDYLKPDTNVSIDKISKTSLKQQSTVDDANTLEWSKGAHQLKATASRTPSVIRGATDYGVSSGRHSGNVPNRLYYYSEIILGDFKALPTEVLAVDGKLSIQPISAEKAFRFRVLSDGKPVADAECSFLIPEGKIPAIKTDAQGECEIPIEASGLYGIRVKIAEEQKGELDGVSYERVHHWSTLVLELKKGE